MISIETKSIFSQMETNTILIKGLYKTEMIFKNMKLHKLWALVEIFRLIKKKKKTKSTEMNLEEKKMMR
jgi:hypothetical protein